MREMEVKRSFLRALTGRRTLVALAAVLLVLVVGAQNLPVTNALPEGGTLGTGPGRCLADVCAKASPCTAGDTKVTSVRTYEVIEPCTYIGDTGTYRFVATFEANATTRYDPGVWIATDGGNAKNGACYADYLSGTLKPVYSKPFPPYWDAEQNGDRCGDMSSADPVELLIGPVTIQCTASNTGGTINTCTAYDNNAGNNCPANNNCPDVGSKCFCGPSTFEVNLNRVDLQLLKAASTATIPPDGLFEYHFTVSNVQSINPCNKSTGYKITDNLPVWLKARNLPAGCTTTPDLAELCSDDVGGCQGYGDVVSCLVSSDLLCGAQAPGLTLPVQFWMGSPAVQPDDPRYGGLSGALTNSACVAGNEVDPASANNCGTADISQPLSVDLLWFEAAANDASVTLGWETATEIDNLGFNILRAATVDGPRTQINAQLIPTLVPPGSPFGAVYAYTDSDVTPGATYYYWLQDVDLSGRLGLNGPVDAQPGPRMHVSAVKLTYRQLLPGRTVLSGSVRIVGAAGLPVAGAAVQVAWTAPDGTVTNGQAVTSTSGIASFRAKATQPGTYRLCVTTVSSENWVYAPDQNNTTCAQVTLP